MIAVSRVVIMAVLTAVLTGCAASREELLERKAEKVEGSLLKEQRRVLSLPATDPDRSLRLDRLSELRITLSAANVGRGAVPYVIEKDKRELAWDVLDEVYATIEWNIPLGPADRARPLPSGFTGGRLNLDVSQPLQPAGQ